jgi:hypothetical protein
VGLFIATFLATFGVILVALVLFWRFASPVYRVERDNVICLLELIVAGKATESDWHVFESYLIRHNEKLQRYQLRCLELGEKEYTGKKPYLFSPSGLSELKKILEELKADNCEG